MSTDAFFTDEDLDKLEAATEATTPYPWTSDGCRVNAPASPVQENGSTIFETKHFTASVGQDAEFCALARNCMPKLLKELRIHRKARRIYDLIKKEGVKDHPPLVENVGTEVTVKKPPTPFPSVIDWVREKKPGE